jgi:hypothetical protein
MKGALQNRLWRPVLPFPDVQGIYIHNNDKKITEKKRGARTLAASRQDSE